MTIHFLRRLYFVAVLQRQVSFFVAVYTFEAEWDVAYGASLKLKKSVRVKGSLSVDRNSLR